LLLIPFTAAGLQECLSQLCILAFEQVGAISTLTIAKQHKKEQAAVQAEL